MKQKIISDHNDAFLTRIHISLVYAFLCIATLAIPTRANFVTSHTTFIVRQPFQSGSSELVSLFHDRMTARGEDGRRGAIEIVPFGSTSNTTRESKRCNQIATFLMPFGKTTLVAGETGSQAVTDGSVDIVANYFGVLTADPFAGVGPGEYNFTNGTFQSTVSLDPKQTMTGVGFCYRQKLSECPEKPFWLSISFPIIQVKNELNYKEHILNAGGGDIQPGYVGTIGEALRGDIVFGNKRFRYGKIPRTCAMKRVGVADIDIKIGRTSVQQEKAILEGYAGVVIPTGNRPTGEYIFEPIVGNNHHIGVSIGSNYSFHMWHNDHVSIWVEGVIDGRFLFPNTQRRSFDLFDKQWSRYMWVYPNEFAVSLVDINPGINFLTQDVRVHPVFAYTFNTAFVVAGPGLIGEFSFNRYARQAERICLARPWQEGPGIVGIDAADANALHTKSHATINVYAAPSGTILVDSAPTYIPIKESDLNLESASHPSVITNTIAATVGYRWDYREHPTFIGFGGSYEFSDDNTGIERWMLWCKGGVSF